LRVDYAEVSLLGAREDNQDRATAVVSPHAALLVVLDGMGGHAHGELAAELGCKVMVERFGQPQQPLLDPLGFLHLALGQAHEEVTALGAGLSIERRPRATVAACLVQEGTAWFGHMGDSRLYLLRAGEVLRRTRDHSHVELLLQGGLISPEQALTHPLRNFVEVCIGGDPMLPEMSIGRLQRVQSGDVILACTDGFWANLNDADITSALYPGENLTASLEMLARLAVQRGGPGSDNTTAALLRIKD
jgi:serine/threonine protein phosphatase PrpC